METVIEHPVEMDDDLHFLTDWEVLEDRTRTRNARLASVAIHIGVVVTWLLLPKSVTAPIQEAVVRQITPLIAPLTDLTQPTPNKGKIQKEFNVESQMPRPRVQVPASPPPAPIHAPAGPIRKLELPAEKKASPAPAPNLPDAPNVEVAQGTPQMNLPNGPQMAPPPQIQPQEKPKLTLENPAPPPSGRGKGLLAPPDTSVQHAMESVIRSGTGAMVVGDVDLMSGPSARSSINAPPLPGKSGAYMELKFDPQGVDFRPYLIQLLAGVKRNWFTVWPESAKMGRQGRVVIQMAINRNKVVSKLVIASPSGADPLDRAAVSGISMTQAGGLPEFPPDYKGNEIRLQLNFVYNMK
jgi:TonB family protein